MRFFKPFAALAVLLVSAVAYAQSPSIKATIIDANTSEAISFATVSLTREGQTKAYKYSLSSEQGTILFENVRKGKYELKIELLGYKTLSKTLEVGNGNLDLDKIKLHLDAQQLQEASVTALGNQVIIKKDTIEYNATTFRTSDNAVLEDLLKKLPGVEVSDEGEISVNGETISKITIDGKTFFLDDPQMASKNIPAKLVNKLKVIKKKSEQAEFTGIDDGNEENVIDLSIKPGMMKGLMGNLVAGAGYDIPSPRNSTEDFRYIGNAFVGHFDDKTQISLILNANNNNNQGSTDRSGNMMRGMRGGRGGGGRRGGITNSYMAGLNAATNFLDDKMEFGGNYIFNGSDNVIQERSLKQTFLPEEDLFYRKSASNLTSSLGHSFGLRIDHKFSENTSILFQPQINFGTGSYSEVSNDTTYRGQISPDDYINNAYTRNNGGNKNASAGGFLLFRQRLGIPGRTLSAMIRANFSSNLLNGINRNGTNSFEDGMQTGQVDVNQRFDNKQSSSSMFANLTYTEPLGDSFYIEANYSYTFNRSSSDKQTFDLDKGAIDYNYSNEIINDHNSHRLSVNGLYQKEKIRAQLGFSAMPTYTYNKTTRYNPITDSYDPREYRDRTWRFSPQAMLFADFSESSNMRLFYFGNSNQPSTSQLMPVPDNSDPLNVSFGNPSLKPYFSHSMRAHYRYSDRARFASVNVRFNAEYVDNSIVNVAWYGANGGQYSMPINGPATGNFGVNMFANLPIAKTKFSIVNNFGTNYRRNSTFLGNDMPVYDGSNYYEFMEDVVASLQDKSWYKAHILENVTRSINFNEMLRVVYRADAFETSISGRTRMNHSRYTLTEQKEKTTTWNNRVSAEFIWNWQSTGISVNTDFDYNWYRGYSTAQPSEAVLNAEISKSLLKNTMTVAVRAYDILAQSKNLTVTDNANYHNETINNTLGRYIILSLTWRFGTMGNQGQRGGRGGYGGGHGMIRGGRGPMMM